MNSYITMSPLTDRLVFCEPGEEAFVLCAPNDKPPFLPYASVAFMEDRTALECIIRSSNEDNGRHDTGQFRFVHGEASQQSPFATISRERYEAMEAETLRLLGRHYGEASVE